MREREKKKNRGNRAKYLDNLYRLGEKEIERTKMIEKEKGKVR